MVCRHPTGYLQTTRATNHHDHRRRRLRPWLSTASRRRGRRLWATRGLLGWVVVAGGGAPSVDGRTPLGGVLPAHNGHATRSGADAGPTTASGRDQSRPGYGRPRSHHLGWACTGPVPGPDASRDRGLQAPNGVPANHTRNQSPRPQAAASSPLVVHSVPTARPSAVGNQGLAWVGGGGWGRRTQCGRPDTSGGCPARPQWARHAIGRGRGPDHSIGARSVAPRLWTAPLTPPGLGMHRPRAGAGRFAAVAETVCAAPIEGAAHTGG